MCQYVRLRLVFVPARSCTHDLREGMPAGNQPKRNSYKVQVQMSSRQSVAIRQLAVWRLAVNNLAGVQ